MFCTICTSVGGHPRTLVVIIYLQVYTCPPFGSDSLLKDAPTIVWVAHLWGLPRSTQFVSKLVPSLWHFHGYIIRIQKDVGFLPAVNLPQIP